MNRLRYFALLAGTAFPITQSYGRRGLDENFARGTGSFRSLHGGRMPAFARCCFCIAASLLVFTSPMKGSSLIPSLEIVPQQMIKAITTNESSRLIDDCVYGFLIYGVAEIPND